MSFNCEIIADSVNPQGDRITTMKITFPRFILAEFNTHRMFSRNSASSRAIPFNKMVKMVEENPFIPIAWQKDHKGMQGTDYITSDFGIKHCENLYLLARNTAVESAKKLRGIHGFEFDSYNGDIYPSTINDTFSDFEGEEEILLTKQLCNRLLEAFMWHTVIVTSGKEGLYNFYKLRCPEYTIDLDNLDSLK